MEPGWYADPQEPRFERFWDGYRWTAQQRPVDREIPTQGSRPRRKPLAPWPVIPLVVGVAAIVVGVFLVIARPWEADDTQSTKYLSHTAVESSISKNFGAKGVVCNRGLDIAITPGASFSCSSTGGRQYDVVVTDEQGTYRIAG